MDIYKKLRVGDTIIIKLQRNDCHQGIISSIGKNGEYIKLDDVYDLINNRNIRGIQFYYRGEIQSVVQHNINSTDASTTDDSEISVPDEHRPHLSPDDCKRIMDRISNAIYIQQCDHNYHDAIKLLRSREFIAVALVGSNYGRLRPPSLLSLATEDQIFILDLVSFGRLFNDIKHILESEHPRKILFDSRLVIDSLSHSYKCQMDGFTDLLVAHAHITKQLESITLQECIGAYIAPIKLPDEKHPNDLKKRPVTNDQLHSAACSVGFLHKLYGIMVHDQLLQPLTLASKRFSGAFAVNENVIDAFNDIAMNSQKGFDGINMDSLSRLGSLSVLNTDETQTISSN